MTPDDENVTQQHPVPPHETTPSPVDVSVAMPRYFGVTPPTLLFGIATATLAVAVVLAILALWIAAIVLGALVLVELALFLSLARRKPDTPVARVSARTATRAREHAAWLVRSMSVRTEAGRRLTRLRHEVLQLDSVRERKLRDLGAAVYEGDEAAVERVKAEVATLDDERGRKEDEMRAIEEAARQDLERGRQEVQPTVVKPPVEDESRSPSGS